MPLYEFTCIACGRLHEFLFSPDNMPEISASEEADLTEFGKKCDSCRQTVFIKQISAHGKTAMNWHAWNEKRTIK